MAILPPKVEIDFTDELLTSKGGLTFLARFASLLHLPQMLAQKINLKLRNRGPLVHSSILPQIYLSDKSEAVQSFRRHTNAYTIFTPSP